MTRFLFVAAPFALLIASAAPAAAQMDHASMHNTSTAAPSGAPGQAAFATIQEIVRKLKADPATDWSKVNIEALRQHLIDMDDVVMRAKVAQTNAPGGVTLDITGTPEVAAAIQRMAAMHAMALAEEGAYVVRSAPIDGGVRLTVTAKAASDARRVAMIRGLGFAGLLTEGDHHAAHHLMLARGEPMMHEHK